MQFKYRVLVCICRKLTFFLRSTIKYAARAILKWCHGQICPYTMNMVSGAQFPQQWVLHTKVWFSWAETGCREPCTIGFSAAQLPGLTAHNCSHSSVFLEYSRNSSGRSVISGKWSILCSFSNSSSNILPQKSAKHVGGLNKLSQ